MKTTQPVKTTQQGTSTSSTQGSQTQQSVPDLGSNSAKNDALPSVQEEDVFESGFLGSFLTSLNNFEELENIQHHRYPGGKKKREKARKEATTSALNEMVEDGSVKAGESTSLYQSSHDTGLDFGAEHKLDGIWGDEYVLHGHYDESGAAKSGSLGLKKSSNKYGPRLNAWGKVDDDLAPDAKDLGDEWTNSSTYQAKKGTP